MNIKIIGLILPWETYFLPKIISSFISCKSYLTEEACKNITFSLRYSNVPEQINWDKSSILPSHTEFMFSKCCKLLSKYYNVDYKIDDSIKGCVGHRRIEFNKNDYDYCITFDPDMNFPSNLLKTYYDILTSKLLNKEDLLVLTPQTSVMWDESWKDICYYDINSRDEYFKKPERFNIDLIQPKDRIYSIETVKSKWYGGMFPCYSKGYLKEYPLHKGLGDGYGPDDYYLELKGKYGPKKHIQYLIKGLIVENSKSYYTYFNSKENYKFNYFAKRITDDQLMKLI